MILNITSFPRSGNSFFSITLLAFEPTWRHAGNPVKFRPTGSLFSDELLKFGPPGLSRTPYANRGSEDRNPAERIKDEDNLYVYKRHDHPDDYVGPRIYVVRDGRDVLTSYARHNLIHGKVVNNLKLGRDANHGEAMRYTQKEFQDELRRLAIFTRWGEYVLAGIRHPNTVSVVRYEDLKKHPLHVARRALASAGLEVTPTQANAAPSFEELQKGQPWFYYRGQVGIYKEDMPEDIEGTFWATPSNKEAMTLLGYT
jgi:hypothetical protein